MKTKKDHPALSPETYTIREVSAQFCLPPSTLRYYEESGLLPFVPKTTSGQRVYTKEHIDRLHSIECFKNTGMSIAQMKEFFTYENDMDTCIDDMLSLLETQKTDLKTKLASLDAAYKHIEYKLDYYGAVREAIRSGKPKPGWDEYFCNSKKDK